MNVADAKSQNAHLRKLADNRRHHFSSTTTYPHKDHPAKRKLSRWYVLSLEICRRTFRTRNAIATCRDHKLIDAWEETERGMGWSRAGMDEGAPMFALRSRGACNLVGINL